MALYTFRKGDRIRRRTDFQKISREGKRYQSRHFRVSICSNGLPHRRLGITVGKKVGSARLRRSPFGFSKYLVQTSGRSVMVKLLVISMPLKTWANGWFCGPQPTSNWTRKAAAKNPMLIKAAVSRRVFSKAANRWPRNWAHATVL